MTDFPLGRVSQRDVRLHPQRALAFANYYRENYDYFAHQRSLIIEQLKDALASNVQKFGFSQWQRIVTYSFSLEPLSTKGSILNDLGGRFNIGDIDSTRFPRFGALYLAEDRETAFKEKFGLSQDEKHKGLTAEELSLTSNESISIVNLRGEIFQVLDLCTYHSLKVFYALI